METETIYIELTLAEEVVPEQEASSTKTQVVDHEVCGEGFISSSDLTQAIAIPHSEIENDTKKKDSLDKESSPPVNSQITNMKYVCKVCGKRKARAADLNSHMIFHGAKKFKCDQCDKAFYRRLNLREHKHTHTGEKPYQCEICNRRYAGSNALRTHKKTHQGVKFNCDVCSKVFAYQHSLSHHILRVHKGIKKYKCKVPECNKVFSQPYLLARHENSHVGIRNFMCEVCGKSFLTKACLKTHRNIHTGIKFTCQICSKTFNWMSSLCHHMNSQHNAGKLSRDKSFSRVHDSKKRKIAHPSKKLQICKLCDRTFSSLNKLRNHDKFHKGINKCMCTVCGKSFAQSHDLNSHEKIHTKITTKKVVPVCKICGKKFANDVILKKHMNTHSGVKFPCKTCDKVFAWMSSLCRHMALRHGVWKYKCETCGKDFPYQSHLTKHKMNVHSKIETVKKFKSFYCLICGAGFIKDKNLRKHLQTRHSKQQLLNQFSELKTTICPLEIREVQENQTAESSNVETVA